MQKTVYRVRTQSPISRRIAADVQREAQTIGRIQTTHTLHGTGTDAQKPGTDGTESKIGQFENGRQYYDETRYSELCDRQLILAITRDGSLKRNETPLQS